jgi:hypothetical protein
MNVNGLSCAFALAFLPIFYFPAKCQLSAVSNTEYKSIRECSYASGLVLRLPSARQCPTLKIDASIPLVPNGIEAQAQQPQSVRADQMDQVTNAKTSGDVILEKAVSRCMNIGFKRDTAEFRSCVTEQIRLLSK